MAMSKADQIEEWLHQGWKKSTGGTGAKWKNIRGYHVAVMEDHKNQGRWFYRIGLEDSAAYDYSQTQYSTEDAAKRAVLGMLCDKLDIT